MISKNAVREAWLQNHGLIMERIAVIERAVLGTLSGTLTPELVEQARREAHMLAGALGSFGFPTGSQLASEIDESLRTLHSPEEGYALSFKIVALRAALAEPSSFPELPEESSDFQRPSVLYLGPEGPLLERIRSTEDLEVWTQTPESSPGLIVLGELTPQLLEQAAQLALGKEIPVVSVAPREIGLKERVRALHKGVLRFLDQDRDPKELVEEIRRLAYREEYRPRVLALDDDPIMLTILRRLLLGQGVELETVANPEEFWHSVHRQKPDLVLLDLELPDISGQEICMSLRAQPATEDIPVIVITATEDQEVLDNLFAVGVDDCLHKPLRSRQLIFRIRNRLQRTRAIRGHSLFESETGVWTREHCGPLFQRLLGLGDRGQAHVCLALLRLRGAHVSQAVRWLSNSLRGEDLIARWRGDSFLVGLYGSNLDDSAFRINNLLQQILRDHDLEGWAGVANYPVDGGSFEILVERARACLDVARSESSGLIVSYGQKNPGPAPEVLDVVLVEDDALLGPVVLHALETRGYRSCWLQDGEAALKALSGPEARLRPRVVVLDIDLPGASGLEILRRLKEDGALKRTRVLMLTVRSNERETLETLALGAYDHLAKPCSLQIFLQRVQLALNA